MHSSKGRVERTKSVPIETRRTSNKETRACVQARASVCVGNYLMDLAWGMFRGRMGEALWGVVFSSEIVFSAEIYGFKFY